MSARSDRRLPLEQLQPWLYPTPSRLEPITPLDWAAVFGNSHPVEIEVGFGKGLFLLTAATRFPEVNFFGIEILRKYQLFTATRFAKRGGYPNVKLLAADAGWFLAHFVPNGSVQAVHVYFPDPWWKKRHKKRRVFTEAFAATVARILRLGGRLHLATDVEEYFGVMTAIVAADSHFRPLPEPQRLISEIGYQTNFERKALLAGGAVWRAAYERIESISPTS